MVTSNIKVNSEHSIHLYNCIIGYFFLICQFLKPCRLIVVTPNWGVIFVRAVELGDKNRDIKQQMRKTKIMLDKDCIFFWRIFQDIFKNATVNFTGLLVLPNVSQDVGEKVVCQECSHFAIFRHHLQSGKHFHDWAKSHLKSKKALDSQTFVEVVTRLNGLYVVFETPQQNIETAPKALQEETDNVNDKLHNLEEKVVKHVSKVMMTPQQFEILTSSNRHRVLFGEFGSGKTQVLIERVRQTAWEMHFKKTNSVIYLFSFADVEVCNGVETVEIIEMLQESGKLSLNECLLSHFLMSINKRYSDIVTPLNTKTIFNSDLLPPEIHVKVGHTLET